MRIGNDASDINEIRGFLEQATPEDIEFVINGLESKGEHAEFLRFFKAYAFTSLLAAIGCKIRFWKNSNSKRYKTELYLNKEKNDYLLFVSPADAGDKNVLYSRLYDQHKVELLEIASEHEISPPQN